MNYQDGSLQLNNTLFNALLIAYNKALHLTDFSLRLNQLVRLIVIHKVSSHNMRVPFESIKQTNNEN